MFSGVGLQQAPVAIQVIDSTQNWDFGHAVQLYLLLQWRAVH